MNFEELHNITENFCDAHSFITFGKPVFDYNHQCYNDDVHSTFYNSLRNTAFKNEKLTRILVRLTEKEIFNNKEKSIIYILRNIESLLEKHEQFEDEYICQSNRARRARSYEELQSL